MLREVLGQSEQPLSSGGCACSVQSCIPAQRESLSLYFPLEPRKRFFVPVPHMAGDRVWPSHPEPSPQAGRMPSRCQLQQGSPEG